MAELAGLVIFLQVGPLADVLDHAWPSFAGFGVALCAAPAVLGADLAHKEFSRRRRTRSR